MAEHRPRTLTATIASAAALLVALAGCSDAADTAAPSVDPDVASSPSALDPSAPPASTSGDLGQDDLPAPSELGPDWKYRIDMGSAEDGYIGSGEAAIARDPASVIAALTPLGCRPVPLPTPERALEVTYQLRNTPGVGLVLQFLDGRTATAFFDGHAEALRRCVVAPRVDVEIVRDASANFVSTRTEQLGETPRWVESMRVTENEVTLIAVADPTARGVRTVVAATS